MTAPAELVDAVCRALAAHADPERAVQQQAYMKSEMPYWGLTSPVLRAAIRPVLDDPALQPATREDWDRTVRALWDGATHREERYAAVALTGHRRYREYQDPDALPLYAHLIVTGAWWDVVDELASNRVGPILLRHRDIVEPTIRAWAADDDLWLRRTSIISQLTFKDAHRPRPARGRDRRERRGHGIRLGLLDPQGDRLGPPAAGADRPGLGAGLRGHPWRTALRPLPARGAQAPLTPGRTKAG